MLFDAPRVTIAEFETRSGWQLTPEGLCRGDVCIPMAHSGGELDLAAVARAFGSPLVDDAEAGVSSLGPPVYDGDWLGDVRRIGAENYYPALDM